MKKLLLSLLCAAGMTAMASAETVTFTFTGEEGYGMTLMSGSTSAYNPDPCVLTQGDVTVTLNGKSRWWAANTGNELRMYKSSNLVVAVPDGNTITEVVLDAKAPASFSGSGYSAGTWTGNAQSVQIDCAVASGNTPIYSIAITYGDGTADPGTGGDDPVTPPTEVYGLYLPMSGIQGGDYVLCADGKIATPLSASSNYGYLPSADVEVGSDIVTLKTNAFTFTPVEGGFTIQDYLGRYYYQTGTYKSFNVSSQRTDGDVWAVETTEDGAIVIKNVATEKYIQYSEQYNTWGAYADEQGATPVPFAYVMDVDKPGAPFIESLSMLYDFENNDEFRMGMDLTVVYCNGRYCYVYGNYCYGLIYFKDGLDLNAGDVIRQGWTGKVSIFKNLVEMVPDQALTGYGTATVPEPMDVEAEDASYFVAAYNQSAYLRLLNVTFDEATPAADATAEYTGTMGDFTVNFYQRFGLESVEAGTYNVTGFVAVYGDKVQIYPIAIEKASGTESIINILDDESDARYYNINGVEVANPAQGGMYIRVANGKATKVIK